MLSHDKILEIVDGLLGSLRINSRICNLIRNLNSARGELESSPDNSGELAISVINLLARVQRELVRDTELRQEEELKIAIQLATDSIERLDYVEAVEPPARKLDLDGAHSRWEEAAGDASIASSPSVSTSPGETRTSRGQQPKEKYRFERLIIPAGSEPRVLVDLSKDSDSRDSDSCTEAECYVIKRGEKP